jgi:radical SAM protein with 4Fe4S-binding SPASM domain
MSDARRDDPQPSGPSEPASRDDEAALAVNPSEILSARRGPGANCSSIGSVLDVLFLSATAAGAVLAGVAAAFGAHRSPKGTGSAGRDDGRDATPGDAAPSTSLEAPGPGSGRAEPPLPPLRARAEPFGAWVRAGDSTLAAVTHAAARRLGIDGGALWQSSGAPHSQAPSSPVARPLEVHLAVTSRCGAGCTGCYLDARPDGDSPPFEVLEARMRAIAAAGVFTIAFGGGEPLSRPDLGELGAAARALGLVPVVTTSGIGMTRERALSLRSFAQVNVSYDGEADGYALVRGWDGARTAERAMTLLHEAGVPFGVNMVLTRSSFARLPRTLERAHALGAMEAQLLRYKPAGRAKSPEYLAARLSPDQAIALLPTLERVASAIPLRLRIDCALVPFLSGGAPDPAILSRFGVFGCEAGRHLAAVRIDGLIAPCSFGPASGADAMSAWEGDGFREDASLTAWRALHDAEPCRSCPLRAVCRGGCRVVAEHIHGSIAPDPECPRVLDYNAKLAARASAEQPRAASNESSPREG